MSVNMDRFADDLNFQDNDIFTMTTTYRRLKYV